MVAAKFLALPVIIIFSLLASQMIWRFRYAPALDAEGRPIRATLDQRFLVGP